MQVGQVFRVDLLPEFLVGALFDLLEDHVGLEEAIYELLKVGLIA